MPGHRQATEPAEPNLARVAERLATLRKADARLLHALEGAVHALSIVPNGAIDKETGDALRIATATLRQPVAAELSALAGEGIEVRVPAQQTPASASQRLHAVYVDVASAHGAAVALFPTGRLMFVGAACDLALERIETYRSVTNALNTILPQVVAWELREEELMCHCVCPTCGLGACGCIWASLHNIDQAVGGAGVPPDDRGIPLRSPPRPGSQLALAGLQQWDRIMSVDGERVRTVPDLQQALRRHAIGDDIRLGVIRNRGREELVVKHVSDVS